MHYVTNYLREETAFDIEVRSSAERRVENVGQKDAMRDHEGGNPSLHSIKF